MLAEAWRRQRLWQMPFYSFNPWVLNWHLTQIEVSKGKNETRVKREKACNFIYDISVSISRRHQVVGLHVVSSNPERISAVVHFLPYVFQHKLEDSQDSQVKKMHYALLKILFIMIIKLIFLQYFFYMIIIHQGDLQTSLVQAVKQFFVRFIFEI